MITFALIEPRDLKISIAMKGHSLRSFAKEVGVSNSFLSLLINENKHASAKTAKKIADGLGKEINDIFLFQMVDFCLQNVNY